MPSEFQIFGRGYRMPSFSRDPPDSLFHGVTSYSEPCWKHVCDQPKYYNYTVECEGGRQHKALAEEQSHLIPCRVLAAVGPAAVSDPRTRTILVLTCPEVIPVALASRIKPAVTPAEITSI